MAERYRLGELPDKLPGRHVAIAGSDPPAAGAGRSPMSLGVVSTRLIYDMAGDTPRPAALDKCLSPERPALRLLSSYLARGTAVKKYLWSSQSAGARPRAPAASQARNNTANGNHAYGLLRIPWNRQQAVKFLVDSFMRNDECFTRNNECAGPLPPRGRGASARPPRIPPGQPGLTRPR